MELNERAKISNNFKADYFLSIHINATKDKGFKDAYIV
ncbi:MAG: hypothetical protein RSB77_07120 [Bacilli bacterium]